MRNTKQAHIVIFSSDKNKIVRDQIPIGRRVERPLKR